MSDETDIFGGLSHTEILYVYEYLKDLKKTPAARRVGINPNYAHCWAFKTHKKPAVQAAIDAAMGIRAEKVNLDSTWVLEELKKLYEADLEDIITYDSLGEPQYDFSLATPELLRAIESIDISPNKYGTKIKVTMPNKIKLLETIGKHIGVGAFKELVEHSGQVQIVYDDQDKEA